MSRPLLNSENCGAEAVMASAQWHPDTRCCLWFGRVSDFSWSSNEKSSYRLRRRAIFCTRPTFTFRMYGVQDCLGSRALMATVLRVARITVFFGLFHKVMNLTTKKRRSLWSLLAVWLDTHWAGHQGHVLLMTKTTPRTTMIELNPLDPTRNLTIPPQQPSATNHQPSPTRITSLLLFPGPSPLSLPFLFSLPFLYIYISYISISVILFHTFFLSLCTYIYL